MSFSLCSLPDRAARRLGKNAGSEQHSLPSYDVYRIVNAVHSQSQSEANVVKRPQAAAVDAGSGRLWFTPPVGDENRRRALTRERVVAEARTVIGADGVDALSMRALATRLGVVPGALYRHVRNKEQLHDLVLDGVLAEVDCELDHALAWTERVKVLAHRLRTVLEDHPGIAGLLKTRDPLGPHSLALAEAFLAPLQAAGLPERETGLAFFLVYDYTLGFALSSRSVNDQRVQDAATRRELHAFFRSLPADRFPALVALGQYVWVDNRDERFAAGLDTLVDGLEVARRPRRRAGGRNRSTDQDRAATQRCARHAVHGRCSTVAPAQASDRDPAGRRRVHRAMNLRRGCQGRSCHEAHVQPAAARARPEG
jgi:AcrR family transcriptional regulator